MKKIVRLFFAIAVLFIVMIGMSESAFAFQKDINTTTGEGAPCDSGIVEITNDTEYVLNFTPSVDFYENIYIDDVLKVALGKIDEPTRATGMPDLDTFNAMTPMIASMCGITDGFKPVARMVCTWNSADDVSLDMYFYTEPYYEEHYGSPKINSVTVDFHNSIKAGATFNDIKNIVTVSTTPNDTVTYFQYDDIPDNFPSGIMHGSEYIEDDEPLEVGQTYYINLYYKSSNCDFVAESDDGYPVNNITYNNMGNCSVYGSTEEYVMQYDEGANSFSMTKQSDYINLYFQFDIEPIKITSMAVDFNNKFVDGASVDDLKNQIDLKFYSGSELLPIGKSDITIRSLGVYDILAEEFVTSIQKNRSYGLDYTITVPDEYNFDGADSEWTHIPPNNRIDLINVKKGTPSSENLAVIGELFPPNYDNFYSGVGYSNTSIWFAFDSVIAGDKSELPVNPPKKKPAAVEPVRYFSLGNVKKTTEKTNKKNEVIDRDTFKSEAPAHTVIASETATDAYGLFDLKVHKADAKSTANQEFLAKTLVGPNVQILLTQNIYPRRDLAIAENGALKKLTWNNLPKNQAGPIFAVVYNETDGAYVINGTLDANGTAVFNGFKLRTASTITICK